MLDGAVWVEPSFYAPHHRDRFGADEDDRRHGARRPRTPRASSSASGVGLMLAADRTVEPSVAVEQARLAATRAGPRRRVVRPRQRRGHRAARALRRGVRHRQGGRPALDARTPVSWPGPESVWGALDTLAARPPAARRARDRGPRAGEAPRRLRHRARRVPHVEPAAVGVPVARRAPAPPAARRRDRGAASTATTRCCSAPCCSHEYELARTEMGLDDAALASMARASITGSGAPDELKASALRSIDDWLATS